MGAYEKCKNAKKQKMGCKNNNLWRGIVQKSKKANLLETTQKNSYYCYLLLSEVHLQEVLDFMSDDAVEYLIIKTNFFLTLLKQ
jgi:hypothetical protein